MNSCHVMLPGVPRTPWSWISRYFQRALALRLPYSRYISARPSAGTTAGFPFEDVHINQFFDIQPVRGKIQSIFFFFPVSSPVKGKWTPHFLPPELRCRNEAWAGIPAKTRNAPGRREIDLQDFCCPVGRDV